MLARLVPAGRMINPLGDAAKSLTCNGFLKTVRPKLSDFSKDHFSTP
jgi:hypothetical protein